MIFRKHQHENIPKLTLQIPYPLPPGRGTNSEGEGSPPSSDEEGMTNAAPEEWDTAG